VILAKTNTLSDAPPVLHASLADCDRLDGVWFTKFHDDWQRWGREMNAKCGEIRRRADERTSAETQQFTDRQHGRTDSDYSKCRRKFNAANDGKGTALGDGQATALAEVQIPLSTIEGTASLSCQRRDPSTTSDFDGVTTNETPYQFKIQMRNHTPPARAARAVESG
jgi:hypothetical protein